MERTPPKDVTPLDTYQAKGAAIRIEKQTSYSASCESSASKQDDGGSNQKPRDAMQPEFSVTSAFAAAEIKVRKSQMLMFNMNSSNMQSTDSDLLNQDLESIDVIAPSIIDSPNRRGQIQSQSQNIQVPSHSQQMDEYINEIVMTSQPH